MIRALIDHLARGIDILDFGDSQHRGLGFRPALPNRTGADHGDGKQAEAQ